MARVPAWFSTAASRPTVYLYRASNHLRIARLESVDPKSLEWLDWFACLSGFEPNLDCRV